MAQLSHQPHPSSLRPLTVTERPKLEELPLITAYSPDSIAFFKKWFPGILFIAKSSWTQSNIHPRKRLQVTDPDAPKCKKGPSQESENVNVQAAYMEGPDGDTLGGHMVQEIRNYHRTCFAGMKERGEARWLSSDLTEGTMTRFCEDSAKRFPVVRLCVDGWKARELLRKAWPGWAQDHLPDLNPAGLGKSKKGKRAKAESVLDDSDPETNEMTQIDMNSLIRMPAKDEDKEAVSVVATLTGPPPSLRVDPAIPVIVAAPLFPSVVAHAPPSYVISSHKVQAHLLKYFLVRAHPEQLTLHVIATILLNLTTSSTPFRPPNKMLAVTARLISVVRLFPLTCIPSLWFK